MDQNSQLQVSYCWSSELADISPGSPELYVYIQCNPDIRDPDIRDIFKLGPKLEPVFYYCSIS